MNWEQHNESTTILASNTGRVVAMVYLDPRYNLYQAIRYNQNLGYFKDHRTALIMAEPTNTHDVTKIAKEPQADLMPWDS